VWNATFRPEERKLHLPDCGSRGLAGIGHKEAAENRENAIENGNERIAQVMSAATLPTL
jgi:hypothetical protein